MTPIPNYIRALTYRGWGASELLAKNLAEADALLERAYGEWMQIPASTGIIWSHELLNIAYSLGHLGAAYFQARKDDVSYLEKGRSAFHEAQKVIETLSGKYGVNNDYTIDARGITFQSWGLHEYSAGLQHEGQQFLGQAEQEFQRLSDSFAWKNFRLAELKQVQSQIAQGEVQMKPSTQTVPSDLSSQPKRLPGVMYADEASIKPLTL